MTCGNGKSESGRLSSVLGFIGEQCKKTADLCNKGTKGDNLRANCVLWTPSRITFFNLFYIWFDKEHFIS